MRERLRQQPLTRDLAAMVLVFTGLRVGAVVGPAVHMPDSPSYLQLDFFGGAPRLWTVPLFYKLLLSDQLRVAGQLLLGIVAWSVLAVAVARAVQHPVVARGAAAFVLVLGLTVQVTQWDVLLLSESIAISLGVLLIASILHMHRQLSSRTVAVALGLVVVWVFARHTDALLFIVVVPFVVAWILWRLERRMAVSAALVLLAIAVWGGVASFRDDTVARFNAFSVLSRRLLQDPEATRFFLDRDLPAIGELRRDARHFRWGRSPVLRDERFRRWVRDDWTPAYVAFLLEHPFRSLRRPFGDASWLLSSYEPYAETRHVLPPPVQDLVWARSPGDLAFMGGVAVGLWLVSLVVAGTSRLDALPWFLVAVCALWFALVWHGAGVELIRLTVPVGVTVRLALVIMAAVSLDRILAEGTVRRTSTAATS